VLQVDAVMKDQRRLNAAIGQEDAATMLRQVESVFGHCITPKSRKPPSSLRRATRAEVCPVWCRKMSRRPRRPVVRLNQNP
jgi:hypothetical protein